MLAPTGPRSGQSLPHKHRADAYAIDGSIILTMDNEHTSHRYAWYELAGRSGARVVKVSRRPGEAWGEALVAAIRGSEAPVSIVAGTLVHWFEGMSVDIEAVAEAAHAVGASLVMDGIQWVGAIPFDVSRVRPDFPSFATYKFLLGPYRLASLYADAAWHEKGQPIEFHSWNRASGDRPDFYLETMPDCLPGVRRFDMGERSDFAVLPVAIEALEVIRNWGVEAVHERWRISIVGFGKRLNTAASVAPSRNSARRTYPWWNSARNSGTTLQAGLRRRTPT